MDARHFFLMKSLLYFFLVFHLCSLLAYLINNQNSVGYMDYFATLVSVIFIYSAALPFLFIIIFVNILYIFLYVTWDTIEIIAINNLYFCHTVNQVGRAQWQTKFIIVNNKLIEINFDCGSFNHYVRTKCAN